MHRLIATLLVPGLMWALACGSDPSGGEADGWIDVVGETGPDVPAMDPGHDGAADQVGDVPSDEPDPGSGDTIPDEGEDAAGDPGEPTDDGDPGPGDVPEEDVTVVLPYPEELCGQDPYQWYDDPGLGAVVLWEAATGYDLTQEAIEAMIDVAGFAPPEPIRYGARLLRFRYVTQDQGDYAEATGMVAYPTSPDPLTESFPVLLSLHGTSGYSDPCAPSNDSLMSMVACGIAGMGFVVVAPDFLYMNGIGDPSGRITPYFVSEATAIASLDSLRALPRLIEAAGIGDLPLNGQLAMFGGSQGGHAALSTLRYSHYYSPEILFEAVVALVPPSHGIMEAASAFSSLGGAAKLGTAILGAWAAWYAPDQVHERLLQVLKEPYATTVPDSLLNSCGEGGILSGAKTPEDAFTEDFLEAAVAGDISGIQPWGCWASENDLVETSLPPGEDPTPVLFVIGEKDKIVSPAAERAAFEDLCAQGMTLQFLECKGMGHVDAVLGALTQTITFLRDRLSGVPLDPADTCVLTDPQDCDS